MSEWKCCANCRCRCTNTDVCPDTAAHLIAAGNQNISHSTPPTSQLWQNESEVQTNQSPTLEDLIQLERKIDQRIKNMPNLSMSNQSLHGSSHTSGAERHNVSNETMNYDLYLNEILILRQRLQEAELKSAIIEEKVSRLEMTYQSATIQHIQQLKQQILNFIDQQFSQFIQNYNK